MAIYTVQQVLTVETSHSFNHDTGVPEAVTEAVVVVSTEATSQHAETLIEEEARIVESLVDTTAADDLGVVALGGRFTPLG